MDRIPWSSITRGPFSRAREWHSHTRSTTTRPRGGGGEVQHAKGTHRHQCHGPGRTPCKLRAPRDLSTCCACSWCLGGNAIALEALPSDRSIRGSGSMIQD
eukprot:scaffold135671_cov29-Attheya_sp.AAC.1